MTDFLKLTRLNNKEPLFVKKDRVESFGIDNFAGSFVSLIHGDSYYVDETPFEIEILLNE